MIFPDRICMYVMWLSAGKASCPLTASVVRWRWSQCVCFRQGCRSSFHQRPRSGKTLPLCKNMRLLYFSSSPLGSGSRENGWGGQSVRGSAWLGYNPYILPFIFYMCCICTLWNLTLAGTKCSCAVNTCVLCDTSSLISFFFSFFFLTHVRHSLNRQKEFCFWTIVFFKYTQKATLQSWREPVADSPGGRLAWWTRVQQPVGLNQRWLTGLCGSLTQTIFIDHTFPWDLKETHGGKECVGAAVWW